MPDKPPVNTNQYTAEKLMVIGGRIRAHRKALRITAIAVAEAAGMSRVTLHRIENGEPTVTAGAYLNAMQVLGLELDVRDASVEQAAVPAGDLTGWIPVRIHLQDYPELKRLAWHVHGVNDLTPAEALGIYERNWRHLDVTDLTPAERDLIDGLRQVFGNGSGHV